MNAKATNCRCGKTDGIGRLGDVNSKKAGTFRFKHTKPNSCKDKRHYVGHNSECEFAMRSAKICSRVFSFSSIRLLLNNGKIRWNCFQIPKSLTRIHVPITIVSAMVSTSLRHLPNIFATRDETMNQTVIIIAKLTLTWTCAYKANVHNWFIPLRSIHNEINWNQSKIISKMYETNFC